VTTSHKRQQIASACGATPCSSHMIVNSPRLRPRYIHMQRVALQMHIVPVVGEEQVERVGTKHFGMVKRAMLKKNPDYSGKTVNNVLSVLSRMVRFWWEREGLAAPHFNAGLLELDEVEAAVYEPEVFERLVEGARAVGPQELAIVLTMGDAGFRQGELRGCTCPTCRSSFRSSVFSER
jgi:hypothetical protein